VLDFCCGTGGDADDRQGNWACPRNGAGLFSVPSNLQSEIGYFSPWTHRPLFDIVKFVNHVVLKILGKRIRQKRKSLNWSQEFLANQAGIDRSYVGGVERGERNFTFTILCQICTALGCDVAALTEGIPEHPK
jgi:DNA-binding XRE family transcriptional regulator